MLVVSSVVEQQQKVLSAEQGEPNLKSCESESFLIQLQMLQMLKELLHPENVRILL